MDERSVETARAVLHALADLAPSAEQRAAGLTIPTEWFRWMPARAANLFAVAKGYGSHVELGVLAPKARGRPRALGARTEGQLATRAWATR